MSVLRILDHHGDTTLEWDVKNKASVAEVRKEFNSIMKGAGFMAFRIDSPTAGEHIKSFDPDAEEILITRPMVGG